MESLIFSLGNWRIEIPLRLKLTWRLEREFHGFQTPSAHLEQEVIREQKFSEQISQEERHSKQQVRLVPRYLSTIPLDSTESLSVLCFLFGVQFCRRRRRRRLLDHAWLKQLEGPTRRRKK